MEKKNNKGIIILMGVIILILVVLCILFATNTITFNHKEIKNEIENQKNTSVKEDNTVQKENQDTKEGSKTEEKKVLYLYTSGDNNAMKGNPEILKIYSIDDKEIDFQYHAVWNEKDISGVAQNTSSNKYVYGDNNYKIELNLNEDSIEVNEYTSGQLTSTVKLFK